MGEGGEGNTGGDTTIEPESGWKPDDSNTLWGWLSNLVNGISAVIQDISNIPSKIANSIKAFFDDVVSAIKDLPSTILDFIKSIFVPDTGYIKTAFNSFTDELKSKFNIDTSAFESLFDNEQAVEDVYTDYEISGVGSFKFKLFDTSFLKTALETFRPIIRGFLVLMILLFNVRQLIGFFGYDAGVVAGRSEHIKSMKEEQK